jgi:3-oxoacyl-[acyl-carrier-protein] synthase III
MKAYIQSISSYIPEKRISNEELAQNLDTSHEWIVSHTGIHFRHIAREDQATSDLAIIAAQRAMEKAGVTPDELDLIICGTASPDHPGFPSTACIIQDSIQAHNAGAVDLLAACTSFVYGLETARTFIETDSARHILVLGAETMSTITNWNDRDCVLFGDGAGAAVVSANTTGSESSIIYSRLRAEGSGAEHLKREAGGSRSTFKIGLTQEDELYLKMNGRKVYTFAVRVIVDTLLHLLEKNNLTFDDIDYIVPHQANIRIIEAAAKRMGISTDKFYMNISEYANTSAASIPIALNEMEGKGMLTRGNKILTVGFGGGLTYGGNYLIW